MMPKTIQYTVLRDTSEHDGYGWLFPAGEQCLGTESSNLFTGDYSLKGYFEPKLFVIERKGSVAEFVGNITSADKWPAFKDELQRLEDFKFPFIVCEFPYSLIESFPIGSGIPKDKWPKLRVSSHFLVKRLWEIQLKFKTKILFADQGGFNAARSLFKRIVEHVQV